MLVLIIIKFLTYPKKKKSRRLGTLYKNGKENGGVSAEWLKGKVGKNRTYLECVWLFLHKIAIES